MVFTVTYDSASNIKLVKVVKKHPVLYNSSLYPSRKTIDEAWEKVAEEVNDTNVWCKERWVNLKNSYKRYLRLKQSNLVKKPYYLAKHMAFLQPSTSLSGSKSGNDNENVSKKDENVSNTEVPLVTPQSPDKNDDSDYDNVMSIGDSSDQSSSSDAVDSANNGNGEQATEMSDTTVQTVVTYGKRHVYTPEEHLMSNPDMAFFISILPEVRQMSAKQKKRFRRELIEEMNNILHPEDVPEK